MVTGEAGLFVRFFIFANTVPDYEKWFVFHWKQLDYHPGTLLQIC
jgi:hypothetical protein